MQLGHLLLSHSCSCTCCLGFHSLVLPLRFPSPFSFLQGFFSWIPVLFRVTDEHIHLKCGVDALQYIAFQKHLLLFTIVTFCLSIGIVLPVNYSGKNGKVNVMHNIWHLFLTAGTSTK